MNFIEPDHWRLFSDETAPILPEEQHRRAGALLRAVLLFLCLGYFLTLWPNAAMAAPLRATSVTAPIATDTTWVKANSPYQVTGSFTLVPQGRTLTIEPGVEVIFSGNTPQINGRLVANGSAAEPILFTSINKTPGGWGGLRVQSPSSGPRAGVELRHLISEYGGLTSATSGGHVQLLAADATIANVIFRQGGSHGVAMMLDSNASVSDSTFTGNGRTVIAVTGVASAGSGNFQNLTASGNGTDAITYENLRIVNHDTLHNPGLPYILAAFEVWKSGKLTVAPGTQVRLQGSPLVRGELFAVGLPGSPITFSSANGVAGSWNGLQIAGDTSQMARATLDHVVLEHGGLSAGTLTANLRVNTAVVTVTNSIIRNGGVYGILVQSNDIGQRHGLTVMDSEISGHPAGAILVWDGMTDPVLRNLTVRNNGVNAIIHTSVLLGEHHWQNIGVPRVIRDLLILNSQSRLVIDPGVTIRFEQNAALDAQGTLQAIGTKNQPIVFTGTQEQPGWWRTIRALSSTSALNLRHCEIGYGGAPWINFANGMVHLGNNGGVIEHCRLHHSSSPALYVTDQSRPLIQYNHFTANAVGLQTPASSALPLDARNNWWGDPSGPTHASNPGGTGDRVSDKVLFKPWLTDPNETGDLGGKLVLTVTGPRQFTPGSLQLYTVYYANQTDQPIRDSVVRMLLPAHAEYVGHTGQATRWPQRHEVFWKLGTIQPTSGGVVTVRVRFDRGLPHLLRDGVVVQLSGSNLPNKPFDEAPYLSYVSLLPATVRPLSPAEVDAEHAAHPALAQHYDAAVAAGYRLGSAVVRRYNTGKSETQITLLRIQPKIKVYYIWRHEDKVTGAELDGSSFTVRRAGQSMQYDMASKTWGPVIAEVSAAAAPIDWSGCMENCIIEKLPGNLLEKASSVFNIAVKSLDCIKAIQGDENAILDCAKALEKVVPGVGEGIDLGTCNADCEQCNGDCNDDKCHCCTQDKLLCDNSDWLYGFFGIGVKKRKPCNLDTGRYLATEVYETCAICEQCVQGSAGPACVRKPPSLTGTASLMLTSSALDGGDATKGTCEVCQAARDPNDIVGPQGDLLPGQVVTYTINYENVGGGDAFDVFIVNKLSQHFDPATLRFSSNNAVYSPYTRSIYWTVGNLTPKGQPGSKGAVTYSVQLKPDLLSSTVISNSAVVHFPSVPEETPTNVMINLIQPLAANPLSLSTNAGQPVNFTLGGRDIQNAPLTFAITEGPLYGTLTGQLPALTYTPGAGFAGEDRVVFTANNGVATSSPADVQITVNPSSAADPIAPTILGVTPADQGAAFVSDAELSTPDGPVYGPRIAATFSEALDPSTVTAGAVTVTSNGESIPVMLRYNATTDQIEILLRTPLQEDRVYQVEVKPTVADRVGNRLAASYTWSFTARPEGAPDTPPPSPVALTVQVNPAAGGSVTGQGIDCGADCTENFAPGAQVELAATPAAGYQFTGWSGACTGVAGCTVVMDSAKTVVAAFAPVPPADTLIATCGAYSVYRNAQGQLFAPGWTGTIKLGANGANTINGTSGRDLMLGLGGNDKLDGKGGDDVLCGGDGNDLVQGGPGNDYLDGSAGNDVLNGGTGDFDQLLAGEGNDVLLDGDGVGNASGGLGNDVFTLALRNGWRDANGQPRFTGLSAGYGDDAVGFAILGSTRFYIEISGDEPGAAPDPLDGTRDALVFAGRIEASSQIVKFERGVVLTANVPDEEPVSFDGFLVDPTTLTDESGAEFLSEPAGGDEPVEESDADGNLIFLPLVSR